ncbi:MAG: hypothetical protein ACRD0U_12920 [Acidimicrobiales bacterium]
MHSMVDSGQLDSLRRQVGGDVETMLAVAGSDVATVELLAASLLASFQVAGAPVELPEVVLDAVEAAGDARSAGLLAAMAVLGRPPVADLARDRLVRLHRAGVRSPLEDRVGALEAVEAQVAEGEGFEVLLALLRRRGQRHPQLAMVVVDHEEHAGAAVDGFLTPPIRVRSIAAAVREVTGRRGATMPPGVAIGPAELAEVLGAALVRTAAGALLVSVELAAVVPVLSLALCGDAAAFAAAAVDAGYGLDLEGGDDEEFKDLVEEVAGHFLEAARANPVVDRAGDLVARSMLDWKWRTGDGELGWWTCSDLEDFLFGYFCSSVLAVDVRLADVPECVAAFLCFLDGHDALEGEPLDSLVAFVAERAASFVDAAADPASWGLAKTVFMGLWEAGVDVADPFEVGAWLDAGGCDAGSAPQRTGASAPTGRSARTKSHHVGAKRKAGRATRRRHR